MKIVILAGGGGTRLWPLSRTASPKQVQPFLDSQTLLQHTWARLRQGFSAKDIYVSTAASQVKLIKKQLPGLLRGHIFVEPVGRNTGPAIGLVAKVLASRYPNEVVATVNSDHYIGSARAYIRSLKQGENIARRQPERIVLLGIRPTYPETGYGYIRLGRRLAKAAGGYNVSRFVEKPSLTRARQYCGSHNYLWNSGLFVFYPQTLLDIITQQAPALAKGLKKITVSQNSNGYTAGRPFGKLPAVSIDYSVIERTRRLAVLPVKFGWSDVGHWKSVYNILKPSVRGKNVVRGEYVGLNSAGNLVYAPGAKLVATIGVSDMVIIDAGDALLVCSREASQQVRRLVEEIRGRRELKRYL